MIYRDKHRHEIKFYAKKTVGSFVFGYIWNAFGEPLFCFYRPHEIEPADPDVFAIDFDGTLCTNKYPDIGLPNYNLIANLKKLQSFGNKLILWTCREGDLLQQAVDWCAQHGLHFDAINDNLPERINQYNCNCRKVSADYYIDDRAVNIKAGNY